MSAPCDTRTRERAEPLGGAQAAGFLCLRLGFSHSPQVHHKARDTSMQSADGPKMLQDLVAGCWGPLQEILRIRSPRRLNAVRSRSPGSALQLQLSDYCLSVMVASCGMDVMSLGGFPQEGLLPRKETSGKHFFSPTVACPAGARHVDMHLFIPS